MEGATLMAATLGGVPLPGVYVQDVQYEWAGKPYRRWTLRTRPMTYAEHQAILDMIQANGGIAQVERAVDGTSHSIGGGAVLFVLDEGGGNSTQTYVYITALRVSRPLSLPARREIDLELEEV